MFKAKIGLSDGIRLHLVNSPIFGTNHNVLPTIRQNQVAELIRRHFSMVLIDQGRLIYGDALVTVTEVKMSPDLTLAKVYLSVYNTDNKQAPILEMEDKQQELRQALAHRVRNHIRRVPDLNFYLDDTLDELEKVDRLLKRLKDDNQMGYSRPEVTAEEE